ncbi:MAG: hypothetical protein QM710_01935 [Flavobacterium sp.]
MKQLLLLISLLASAFIHSQAKTDLETEGLKGKVKKLTRFSYSVSEDSSRYVATKQITEYNEKGFQIRNCDMVKPQEQNVIGSKREYKYDAFGNRVEIRWYSSDTVLSNRKVMVYDEKNQKNQEVEYGQNGRMKEKRVYLYDEKGHEIEIKHYAYDENNLALKQISTYDDRGNLLSLSTYNDKNVLVYEYRYKYDTANNKIEKMYWKPAAVEKTEMKYNTQNKMTELIWYKNDKQVYKQVLTYDANNNVIEDRYISEKKTTVTKRKYNAKNDLIEQLEFENDILKRKEICQFKYDNQGNWVEWKQWVDDGGPGNVGRIIEYYN